MLVRSLFLIGVLTLYANGALAFDLGKTLDDASKALGSINNQPKEEPATPESSSSSQGAGSATSANDNWEAEKARMEAEDKARKEEQARQAKARQEEQRQSQAQEAEIEGKRREEQEKRAAEQQRNAQAEMRELERQNDEREKRVADEALREEAEKLEKEKQASLRNAVIPAPFGQIWAGTDFERSRMGPVETTFNFNIFIYDSKSSPPNTDNLTFVLCEGHGLQKVIWQSIKYDAWSMVEPYKNLKTVLTKKYGNPTTDESPERVYWAGGNGTAAVLVVDQFSNHNIRIRVLYFGPISDQCQAEYEKKKTGGF